MSNLIRVLRRVARKTIDSFYGKSIGSKKEIGVNDTWFILSDNLKNSVAVSGGVGKDITFELSLANDYNCRVLLFDPSPTGQQTIARIGAMPNQISFYPMGLAGADGNISFSAPENPAEGSFTRLRESENNISFECKTLATIFKENNLESIELLKIDIEGFEYDVIENIISSKLNIRQIAVEFHPSLPGIGKQKTAAAISSLVNYGYALIHKRGNDYTFVKSNP